MCKGEPAGRDADMSGQRRLMYQRRSVLRIVSTALGAIQTVWPTGRQPR